LACRAILVCATCVGLDAVAAAFFESRSALRSGADIGNAGEVALALSVVAATSRRNALAVAALVVCATLARWTRVVDTRDVTHALTVVTASIVGDALAIAELETSATLAV
jgi:hypothetical protein